MKQLLYALCAAAAGCGQFSPPPSAPDSTTPSSSCADGARIEDGEDGDDRILVRAGRGGYLYTYADEHGTRVEPSGDFAPTAGGASGSARALRVRGEVGTGDDVFAGLGLSLTEPKQGYDASRYRGIAFLARAPGGAVVRLKLPDRNTDPGGKVCSDCYNDFGVDFPVAEQWTRYEVAFADLHQETGWGEPRPAAVDASALYGVQWQVGQSGPFELWIDDVTFTGCD